MDRSVVATCPGCSEQLRIPAQWADKAVKCKKCGSVVRAKGPVPAVAPVAVPVAGRPSNGPPLPVATPATPITPPAAPGWSAPASPDAPTISGTPAFGPPPAPVAQPVNPYPVPHAPPPGAPPYPVPGAPPQMLFDPNTGQWVPAPPGYPMPPGYPYPAAPGYPMPPGYPYPAPPAGYPYPVPPGTGAYPAAPTHPTGSYPTAPYPAAYPPPVQPAPAPAVAARAPAARGSKNAFAGMDEDASPSTARHRRRQSGSLLPLLVVVGLGVMLLGGGAIAAFVFKEQIQQAMGAKTGATDTAPTDDKSKGATPGTGGGGTSPAAKGPSSRRMLAVSVTKYLYCNPLVGGKNKNGASEFNEAIKGVAFRYGIPAADSNNQLFVVTDADGKLFRDAAYRPMLKDIILDSVTKFLESSRKQDRVVFYFGGHATAKDGVAYLVPAEGDPTDPETLIPLADVWAKLAACPAQQKVVLFDVCRLRTDENAVRPGSEPMSEELEKLLHTPPDGVQVLTSCSAGQTAAEFHAAEDADTPQGSAFLGALRAVSKKKAATDPTAPLPVDEWAKATGDRMKNVLGAKAGTPKVSGTAGDPVVADPNEAVPARFVVLPPPAGANPKDVKEVFATLSTPTLLGSAADQDQVEGSVFFPADALKDYTPDVPVSEIEALGKDLPARITDFKPADWEKLKGQAHRVAAVKALEEIRVKWAKFADPEKDSVLKDGITGKVDDKLKDEIAKKEQPPIADAALELDELLETLDGKMSVLKKAADEDKNKFWQATFRFAVAQAKMRLAFIQEAMLALGQVRTDSIPDMTNASGLRLVQKTKMTEKKYAPMGKKALEEFGELAKAHKGTPFEVLAKQWRSVSLGLEWRAKKADADTTGDMKMEEKK